MLGFYVLRVGWVIKSRSLSCLDLDVVLLSIHMLVSMILRYTQYIYYYYIVYYYCCCCYKFDFIFARHENVSHVQNDSFPQQMSPLVGNKKKFAAISDIWRGKRKKGFFASNSVEFRFCAKK